MMQGYITDVEYTGNFYPYQAPAWLAYIAAINGYAAPPLDHRFRWCELGCGKGITSLLLAATHPQGEFHACDFNPAHIEYAERLRGAAAVGNVEFHLRSFGEMLDTRLPAFDFIVLHGVYSWVPEPVRAQIREFARSRLRSGGLLMVSYNAMPGWAHVQPLRRMMQAYAEGLPGDSLDKARSAFAYVNALAANGAAYFNTAPAAARHLEQIASQDIRYVAHEYLTPHGDPFYFSEVESAMRTAGLSYAGSMVPADNYAELMVPGPFRKLLPPVATRVALELHRDFIANTSFRPDLYIAHAPVPQPADLPLERLDGLAFCLVNLPERLPLRSEGGPLQFNLEDQEAAVRAVHALLADGPASVHDIHRAAGKRTGSETSFLIQQLIVSRHLAPCPPVRAAAGWLQVNSALIEAGMREQMRQVPLACPATGSGSYSEIAHAAAIEAAVRFRDSGTAAAAVLARLRRHGHPLSRTSDSGESRTATDAEVLEYVAATWHSLNERADSNARLLRLFGVLG
jgi:SAM-dependent methyltransferase